MQKYIIDADQINSLIFSLCGEEVKEQAIEEWLKEFADIAPHLTTHPDWSDAPEWAQYRTVDEDGTVMYWEYKPVPKLVDAVWYRNSGKRHMSEKRHFFDWKETLQQRT